MKQSLLIILVLFALGVTNAWAQNKTISGKVTSSDDGLPLPGVSVHVKGTTIGAQTSADGTYSITIQGGAKAIEFSYIGYSTQEVQVGTQSVINVSLLTNTK